MEARNIFKIRKAAISMIKHSHGFNHCGLRDAMINEMPYGRNIGACDKMQ